MTYFSHLSINNWQQFNTLDLDLNNRLTILTGANASGKTTILNLLGRHAGWDVPSLAVPMRARLEGVIRFFTRFVNSEPQIGSLAYDDRTKARLVVPDQNAATYQVNIEGQQTVRCFFLPSHRSVHRYQQVSQIPVVRIDKEQAFQRVWNSNRNRFFGGSENPASYYIKEILISWSIFGRGNQDMVPDTELLSFYEGFQEVLRHVLPPTLGFRRFSIRNTEIVLECSSGEFTIDAVSGGLSAIIELAWELFMFSTKGSEGFTVLIDEIENHLHPTMQRRILPDFLVAFPQVRFIVSTHSPLIVNSVQDSAVYALRYDANGRVNSARLDIVREARTATQILDEVLGVSTTLPIWAEHQLNDLVSRFSSGPIDENRFKRFRSEMASLGLAEYLPQALGKLLDSREQ